MNKLNDNQKDLVIKNHNLIYSYAYKKNVSIEEYYDVLAIGLCKAAKTFDSKKGEFSTLAYRCMERELYTQWNSMQKKSVIPHDIIYSYNCRFGNCDNQDDYIENIVDLSSNDTIEYAIISSEFANSLTDKEAVIVRLLMNGMTQNDIAGELGCKRRNVGYHIGQIRKKLNEYLYC